MSKILVIDDSDFIRDELSKCLQEKGHEVIAAENGLQGLEELSKNTDCSLVFVDINMPVMGGMEFCENIHKQEDKRHIPILVLTTELLPEYKEKAGKLGVKAWIIKPFNKANIFKVLDIILKK